MTRQLSYKCHQQAQLLPLTTGFVDNMINLPWQKKVSPEFETKFQKEVS